MLTVDFDRLDLRAGELLLDVGAGSGRHAREAAARGARVVAVDLDLAALRQVGAELARVQADALHLPFPDGAADRVVVSEVLEHIPADRAAIAEAWRVLKPGGRLAVSVPRWLPERVCWALSREYHDVPGGHVRIYRGGELAAKCGAAGFRPLGGHHAHALHSPYWWLKCAVGVNRPGHPVVDAYHRLLLWDLFKKPRATRALERVLNPLLGKSLVLYFEKPESSRVRMAAMRSSSAGRSRAPARAPAAYSSNPRT
jgi:SAM-dependent methyltransferase